MTRTRSYFGFAILCTALLIFVGTAWSAPKKGAKAKDDAKATPAAPQEAAPALPAAAVAEAKQLFGTLCATCHGPGGKGDGAAAAALNPKPRDFTSGDWQKATKNEAIAKIILEGGAAVGKSPVMPANPNLKGKPEVVAALTSMIRDLGK